MLLITGGAGYIGSHSVIKFIENNYDAVIFDNLSAGHIETIQTLQKINPNIKFEKGDLNNLSDIEQVFKKYNIEGVIHFAGSSLVEESIVNPSKYYQNNVCATLNLLNVMVKNNVLKIVFSSSAAVYGEPKYTPIDENHPKNPINPYGKTKLIIENIMDDYDRAYNLKSSRLRYFNVIGADSHSRLGEWHNIETHLVPTVLKSLFKNQCTFKIFGDKYNTKDGTCIRDYVNVEDLAQAHILAYEYLKNTNKTEIFNIGTQEGTSVREIFQYVKEITKKEIPFEIAPKREGDPAVLCADYKKAKKILGWKPTKTIADSINSAYKWERVLQGQ